MKMNFQIIYQDLINNKRMCFIINSMVFQTKNNLKVRDLAALVTAVKTTAQQETKETELIHSLQIIIKFT